MFNSILFQTKLSSVSDHRQPLGSIQGPRVQPPHQRYSKYAMTRQGSSLKEPFIVIRTCT